MKINTEIEINAKPNKVWEILTDFENYPKWNPFIKSLTGIIKVGNQVNLELKNMKFKPKVLIFEKDKELKWLGHLLVKGLFDGEHCFRLTETKNGKTKFEHSEKFSGILVPFFKNKLINETKPDFIEMNKCLKAEAEKED